MVWYGMLLFLCPGHSTQAQAQQSSSSTNGIHYVTMASPRLRAEVCGGRPHSGAHANRLACCCCRHSMHGALEISTHTCDVEALGCLVACLYWQWRCRVACQTKSPCKVCGRHAEATLDGICTFQQRDTYGATKQTLQRQVCRPIATLTLQCN